MESKKEYEKRTDEKRTDGGVYLIHCSALALKPEVGKV